MLITNMSKTNTDVKKMKKLYRIINIGSLKNESYGNVQFIKPELEIFNEEKDCKPFDKTQLAILKFQTHETHTPESITF